MSPGYLMFTYPFEALHIEQLAVQKCTAIKIELPLSVIAPACYAWHKDRGLNNIKIHFAFKHSCIK